MATHSVCAHRPTKLRWNAAEGYLWKLVGVGPGWYPDYDDWYLQAVCEYGGCVLDLCPVCRCVRGGVGTIGCPCDDLPARYEQRPRPRAFGLKPSIARRRAGRHRARPRR